MEERRKDEEGGRVKRVPLVDTDWTEWIYAGTFCSFIVSLCN